MKTRFVAVAGTLMLTSVAFLTTTPALAQEPATNHAPAAQAGGETGPTAPSDAQLEEAKQRYSRGLQLYNEQNFEAARVEFERAYQLAPTYKILYNIGLAYEQIGDYVQALTTLQRYLEVGGAEIGEDRRAVVAKELAQLRPRVARVTVKTNVPGAEVFVDDQCGADVTTGSSNCGAASGSTRELLVNPGRRRISVRKAGYLPEMALVTVAGFDKIDVSIELKELPKPHVEKKQNPYVVPMIAGWAVTGLAGGASIITGVLAEGARSDQDAALTSFGSDRTKLDEARDKTTTLSHVTDGILIGTGVAALASAYFTIRAIGWKREQSSVNMQVGAGTIRFGGTF